MSIDYAQAFNAALDAIEAGDEPRARELLEGVVTADPRDGEAVLMLCRLERVAGEAAAAKARMEALIALSLIHI